VVRQERVSAADLCESFGVTEEDLALNKQGRLGPAQRGRLHRTAAVNVGLTLLLMGGLLWILLGVAAHPIQWWRWLLVTALELALLVVGARWVRKLVVAARDGVVVRHSGPIHAFAGRGKRVAVAGLTYNLPIPLNRLVQGATYDVYVVELPAMVVAMVPTAPDPGS
jgi:hypothetical protein